MLLIFVSIATTVTNERMRFWNDYILFYEKMEEPAKTPVSAKKSKSGAGGRVSYISNNNNPETLSLCSFIILIFNDKTSFERRRLKCMHKMKEKGLILKYI